MTDRTVLDEVLRHGRTTRAELATWTGISRPTISESVRRLEGAGLLHATGSRTGRRGRVATFYELAPGAGYVLALEVSQAGVRSLAADLAGSPFDEQHQPLRLPGDTESLVTVLREVAQSALDTGKARYGCLRAASLSVANPVDANTREVIALRDSPFPEGFVQPAEILSGLLDTPLLVDNDVNWATLAERRSGAATEAGSFAYVYIGAGLGMGLCLGDQLVRGAQGLAGEIGYLSIPTADGPAPLASALAKLGFGRPDAPSNDVEAVLQTLARADEGDAQASETVQQIGVSIGHAIASVCSIADPELVLLGGPIGSHAALLEPIRATVADSAPRPARIELGGLGESAPLHGALALAIERGSAQLLPTSTGRDH